MTLRPSAPWWSERSRRTRHRLALTGNRPADRVAGSLRTAHSRDPAIATECDPRRSAPWRRSNSIGTGHGSAPASALSPGGWAWTSKRWPERNGDTRCRWLVASLQAEVEDNILLSGDVPAPRGVFSGGLALGLPFGTGVFRAGRTLAQVSLHPRPFRVTTLPQAAAARADLWTNIPPPTTSAPLHPDQPLERSRHTTHLTPPPNGAGPRPKNRGWGQIRPAR